MERYYKVTCYRGHVGIGREAYITFFFQAANLLSAVTQAKKMPGVKHTRPPVSAQEIEKREYYNNIGRNAYRACFAKKSIEHFSTVY